MEDRERFLREAFEHYGHSKDEIEKGLDDFHSGKSENIPNDVFHLAVDRYVRFVIDKHKGKQGERTVE